MKRIVLAATVLAAGLLVVPGPAAAGPVDGRCEVTFLDIAVSTNELGKIEAKYAITAHPPSPDPTQPWTTTRCTLYKGTLDELNDWVQLTVPGPTGLIASTHEDLLGPPNGTTWWICTEVWTTPTTIVPPEYCNVAFWW